MKKLGRKPNLELQSQKIGRILELFGEGKKRFQIVDILAVECGLSEGMVDKYIAMAKEVIASNYDEDILLERYEHLYQKAYESKNYKLCKEINDSIARIKIKEELKISGDLTTKTEIRFIGYGGNN